MDISGSCHCGNISFSMRWPDEAGEIPARRCGCTFCVKHGGVWTSEPRAALRVRLSDVGSVARYAFGTETADFLICTRCGATPLVTSQIEGVTYAVVNVNCFDNVDRGRIREQSASFDGEDAPARLDRRRRKWIADVVLSEGRS